MKEPEIKVTRISNRFHARCILNDRVVDEMACENKQDIGFICRVMLRWLNKMGFESRYVVSSRFRGKNKDTPLGKIWYKTKLDEEKIKYTEAKK